MRPIFKRKLTQLDAVKLRPRTRAFLVWDSLERGLVLKVEPTGYRSYKFIYSFKGRSRWFHIGAADTVSLGTAREQALVLRLQVHRGEDPASPRRASTTSGGTFAALAARYVEEHAKRKNRSWRQGAHLVTRYVLPHLGDRDAAGVTRADIRALLAKVDAKVLQNQILASVSAVFSWSVRQELLQINPCRSVERNTTKSRERVLSEQEIPAFWAAFGNAGIAGEALKVLLLTGQRPGEIAHMRFEHLENGWWTLPGQPEVATKWRGTKNGCTHRVYLPDSVQQIIADINCKLRCTVGFVFGPTIPRLDRAMREICKLLSVPRATPHDLRRTHGTTLTSMGWGRPAMNRIQNHTEGGISSIYDRYEYAAETQKIMEAVAARLIALAEGTDAPTNVILLHS